MQNYEIANNVAVDNFLHYARINGESVVAIKGDPPKYARYSDGDLIERPINIAWENSTTGECIEIIYQLRQQAKENKL